MRKGQFEILGLAIVVLLAVVGVFFILSFGFNSAPKDLTGRFIEDQFAQNTIDALMQTSVSGCESNSVADLIAWSITRSNIPSNPGQGSSCANAMNSLNQNQDLESTLAFINTDFLEPLFETYRGTEYYFQLRMDCDSDDIFGEECETVVYPSEGCDVSSGQQSTFKPGRQSIAVYPHPMSVEAVLWICDARRS